MNRLRITLTPARSLRCALGGGGAELLFDPPVQQLQAHLIPVLQGPPGPPGPSGQGYTHTQASAADEWIVNHNLGFLPTVSVIDAGSNVVVAEVQHPSTTQARVRFALPVSGQARCH